MAIVLWRVNGTFPTYFAFLTAGAILPAMFLYRAVGHLTNWQAVALTTLYVLLTSIIWEVTLAIPRDWWGYEPTGMPALVRKARATSFSATSRLTRRRSWSGKRPTASVQM